MNSLHTCLLLIATLISSGCATTSTSQKYAPPPAVRKAPSVNLNGFPPAYKAGYVDACGNARDAKRFKTDRQYKQGWDDGLAICRPKSASY